MKFPPEVIAAWQARRDQDESCFSIAVDYDTTRQTVARYTVGKPKYKPGPKPKFDRQKVLALSNSGLQDKVISERLGCSKSLPSVLRHAVAPRMMLEPKWWAKARQLELMGYSYSDIAIRLRLSLDAIKYCLDEKHRERKKEKNRRHHLRRKSMTGIVVDYKRQELRKQARDKYKEEGGDLRQIYKEMECL